MNVGRLIEALSGAEQQLYVEDILDALWLATRGRRLSLVGAAVAEVAAVTPAPTLPDPPAYSQPDAPAERTRPAAPVQGDDAPPDARAPVYDAGDSGADGSSIKASPVALPAGRALHNRLRLSRALRPLRQRWPSRHLLELDEERTAEMTAELGGQLRPVFRPLRERWFDVDVILEDDSAIGVWSDTLRDFSQILRDTGAFRDVRTARLRLREQRDAVPMLEITRQNRVPATSLAGKGVRRLVMFATHGFSKHWLDGSYAQLLESWARSSSVVLLHLMDRSGWKRGALGEPDGTCSAPEAGAVASMLRFNQQWWSLRSPEGAARLPIVELSPASLDEWSHMQMARGRRSAMILLESAATAKVAGDAEEPQDYERTVGLLHEASPEAFQLAVYLCAGAFTIPVARLVQEVQFGALAREQDLSEVLLSGLLFTRTPSGSTDDPNELYYEFRAEARAILLRSLRDADANYIAETLEQRVSQYIEAVTGRAITFRALIADAWGQYNLPGWAQPFAQLGLSLLGRAPGGKRAAQVLEEFRNSQQKVGTSRRVQTPATLARAAQIAASIEIGAALDPNGIDPDLWRELQGAGLLQQESEGEWRFIPGMEPLLRKVASDELLSGVSILWVDDYPENNDPEIARLTELGAAIDIALSTLAALELVARKHYDLLISNMGRGAQDRAGMELLEALRQRDVSIPTIIYAASYAQDASRRLEALRAGAFACTNVRHELREWIMEAVGRAVEPALSAAQRMQREKQNQPPPLSGIHGTAAFEEPRLELEDPYAFARGVFLGKSFSPAYRVIEPAKSFAPIFTLPQTHTLIVAPTRTGKGTRVIVPTLLSYQGSVVTIDPKGENAAITARARKFNLGQTVHILNPWNELGGHFGKLGIGAAATYNPLDVLDHNDPNAVSIARTLAETVCPHTGGGEDRFWTGSAANIFAAVLLWITVQPGEQKTLARAREIVTRSWQELREKYLFKMAASSAFSGAISEMISQYSGDKFAAETYSGIVSILVEATQFLSDPQVKHSIATSSFSMEGLISGSTTIYIVVPPERMDTQKTWMRLVLTAAMQTFKKHRMWQSRHDDSDQNERARVARNKNSRCMFLINEFALLGTLDEVPRDIATMAGYGLDMTLIVQSLDQLKANYGDRADTIIGNCAYKWFCSIIDLATATYVSEALGTAAVRTIAKSTSESAEKGGEPPAEGQSTNYGETGRALMTPLELLTLGPNYAIAFQPEGDPLFLKPIEYWNLAQTFAHLERTHPEMYWNPPLAFDENPYFRLK